MSVDLAAIRARAAAATEGPWHAATAPAEGSSDTPAEYVTKALSGYGPLWTTWAENRTGDGFDYLIPALTGDGRDSQANAEFIAHARTDVPALLALVDVQAARINKALTEHVHVNDEDGDECAADNEDWPCPTVRALTQDAQ